MKKRIIFLSLGLILLASATFSFSPGQVLGPEERELLSSPETALYLMQNLGLGISKSDLNTFLETKFPERLAGRILISVEEDGRAYYVDPKTLEAKYLGRPDQALLILKGEKEEEELIKTSLSLETEKLAEMTNFSHIVSINTNINNPDNVIIKEQGLLYDYSISPDIKLNPSLDNYKDRVIDNDKKKNNYTLDIQNLSPGTYPFFRAYLITDQGQVIYGDTITITNSQNKNIALPYLPIASSGSSSKKSEKPSEPETEEEEHPVFENCGDKLYDERDKEIYKTVKIGEQCWFQENLRYLPEVHDSLPFFSTLYPYYGVAGYSGEDVAEAKKVKLGDLREQGLFTGDSSLSDNTNIYKTFGVLYNWNAVMRDGPDSICPIGWHLSTKDEWSELAEFYEPGGFINVNYNGYIGYWSEAAGYLKANFSSKWKALSGQPDLRVLPGGFRNSQGPYIRFGEEANFWTATNNGFKDIKTIYIGSSDNKLLNDVWWGESGLSVRCLKDD